MRPPLGNGTVQLQVAAGGGVEHQDGWRPGRCADAFDVVRPSVRWVESTVDQAMAAALRAGSEDVLAVVGRADALVQGLPGPGAIGLGGRPGVAG